MKYDVFLDLSGFSCPIPLNETKKRLVQMKEGEVIKVLSTDPASKIDFPVFCHRFSHRLEHEMVDSKKYYYWIKKAIVDNKVRN